MMRTTLLGYLSAPALLAVGIFVSALGREPFGIEMFLAYIVSGFLFYAAPLLLWAIVATLGKFSRIVWHSGFVASCLALVVLAVFSLFFRDPSGLPMQWLLYWPLAIILQIIFAGSCALYVARKRSKKCA